MNPIDKLVAQKNGPAAKLPPFHKYLITFEPQGNEFLTIEKEGSLTFAVIGAKKKIVINKEHLIYRHNIYYDDPEETEEERIAIVNRLELGDGLTGSHTGMGYKERLIEKIKLYEPKAELTFNKRIRKLNHTYKPVSELQLIDETEIDLENEEKESETDLEFADKPSLSFMERIQKYIKK